MVRHDIAEILLKLALNTNQSTVFMVCIEKLDVIQVKVLFNFFCCQVSKGDKSCTSFRKDTYII